MNHHFVRTDATRIAPVKVAKAVRLFIVLLPALLQTLHHCGGGPVGAEPPLIRVFRFS